MQTFDHFKTRRTKLIDAIKNDVGSRNFFIVLCAEYEQERYAFRQESSFYYLTGVSEPGVVAVLYGDGRDELYLPNFGDTREKWVNVTLHMDEQDGGESAKRIQFSSIKNLGKPARGYSLGSYFEEEQYCCLLDDLRMSLSSSQKAFTLIDGMTNLYDVPASRFDMIADKIPGLFDKTNDCATYVHRMRKTKDEHELSLIQEAVDVTCDAQREVARTLRVGDLEYRVRANLERVFVASGCSRPAFPSIVATGVNTTVLHYTDLNHTIRDGDLVVVDIGAEYGCYAADITRTFPANGTFTERQKEIYNAVLETQEYIASIAKPGMYLRKAPEGQKALHQLSVEFLKQRGLDSYYIHGIGHYMGLDVHDVGSYDEPLKVGDVFTIEPGVYIREESLGVRIEDDYVITADGVRCMSGGLSKTVDEIEKMMKG